MKKNTLFFYILLILLTVTAVYSNHFYNGFHFDDVHSVWNNPNIRNIKNIPHFFKDGTTSSVLPQNQSYRPVTTASLAIDYWLGQGYDPFFFHLSTFITFLLQGILMVFFFNKVFGLSSANKNVIYVALFATAWYLLHPAIAETVNYIIARADIQSTLAVVAGFTMYAFSPFCRRTFIYLIPVGIGILAKPPAVMFAPIFFCYTLLFDEKLSLTDIFKRVHLKQLWNAIKRSIPAFIVCAGMYVLVDRLTPKTWVPGGSSPLLYLITQPYVIFHYFLTFFWPTGLSADSDWQPLDSIWHIQFFIGCLFVLVMFVIAFLTSRSEKLRPISLGILWFFIALAPTSSIIPLAEVLNDHRMFFPFVGLVMSVSWTIGLIVFKLIENGRSIFATNKKLLWLPVMALFLACAYGTWKRNNVWHSEESLWRNVTLKSPENGRGLMNYGILKVNEGKYAEAKYFFDRALKLAPTYSFIYVNLGVLYEKKGDYAEAEKNYLLGLSLNGIYPSHYAAYGQFLNSRGRYAEAEAVLKKGLTVSNAFPAMRLHLMQTYETTGQWDKLRQMAESTLQLTPGDENAMRYLEAAQKRKAYVEVEADKIKLSPTQEKYLQLSLDYYLAGKYEQCVNAAQQAITLKSNYPEAYNNIGSAYIGLQQYDKAIEALNKAISLKPDYTLAKNNLAEAKAHHTDPALISKTYTAADYINQSLNYFNYKMYDLCIVACNEALALKPDYDLAYNNLCAAYNMLGQWDKAIEAGNKGLQLNPDNIRLKNNLEEAINKKKTGLKK